MGLPGSGLPGGSDGKESVCNAGDLGSIPGLGRSSGEGNGTTLGASLVAQRVKCLPAVQETWVQSGSGRTPGEGNDNPLQCSCLENPCGQRSLAGYSPWSRKESATTEQLILMSLYWESKIISCRK